MSSDHPDYALIARMEREIYGQTFGHEKAPGPTACPESRDKGDACWYCGQYTTRKYRPLDPEDENHG